MRKIFISILSAAVLAACSKSETEDIVPAAPGQEAEAQSVYVEIGVTAGSETKATYDGNLQPYWEAGDQILAVQGSASSETWYPLGPTEIADGKPLYLNSGAGEKSAVFSGEIEFKDTKNNRFFHFAYPETDISLKTTTVLPSTALGDVTTTTTCTYTVPSEQDGKWTPFLCASTAGKTTAANIESIAFGKTRNACLAVRVYEKDGKTPKRIKSITITAANNIVGTMSATTDNDGSFAGKEFAVSGTGNEITADNLQDIEPLNGLCEYRFEVLPVNAGVMTLKIVDENGSEVVRTTSTKTFTANHRSGVNVAWDAATISMDKPMSWYEDSTSNHISSLNTKCIYVNNINIHGVGLNGIQEMGVYYGTDINGELNQKDKITSNNISLNSNLQISNLTSGEYEVIPYAILNNGETIHGAGQTVRVTEKLAIDWNLSKIYSSYTENGETKRTNDYDGDKIYAEVHINDDYAANNLVQSAKLHYKNDSNESIDIDAKGTQAKTGALTWDQYTCYAEITFTNGVKLTLKPESSAGYTINVTGIPYSINFDSTSPAGWEVSNIDQNTRDIVYIKTTSGYMISPKFFVPDNIEINVTVPVYAYSTLKASNYKPSVYISASNTAVASGTPQTLSGGNDTNPDSYTNINRILKFNNNTNKVCIYANGQKPSNLASCGVFVKSCNINYNK